MKILGILLTIGWWVEVSAADVVRWNQGVIVMSDGNVRQGELAYQMSEMVLFRTAGEVSVLPAYKIHSFRYYDARENVNRKFVSRRSLSGTMDFYEMIVVGEVSVVRRFSHQVITNRKKSDIDDYDYFVCLQDNLVPLKQFRNKVYPNLLTSSHQMEIQIKTHHLNPNRKADAIQIIQLYNKATSVETLVAGI